MEGEGLVTLETNKGARVTSLSLRELDLLYESRAALEPIVIADSVAQISDVAIAEAQAIITRLEAGVSTVEFLLLDRDFHLLTYSGCSSPHLLSIVERLWNATQQYRRAFITSTGVQWREETNLEHRLLMSAVAGRSSDVAAKLIASHITRTRVALRKAPEIFSVTASAPGRERDAARTA